MRPAVAILMLTLTMKVSAQEIDELCKKNPVVPCRQNLKDGPWYQLDANRCVRAFFYTQNLNFDSAEAACNKYIVGSFKGQLVSIHNQDELNKVLCAMYKVHPGKPHYWIGLKLGFSLIPFQKPPFLWTDGHKCTFTNWARGQPDNSLMREGCVEMNYWSWGLWNDAPCGEEKPYTCQVRLA
ncbi:lectin-like [Anabas testudineus]|uniref:C-type lectin domain-containing protein n=1 Tax=Anabas testudineus TaxID=64144 RepID=A0A3Q1JVC3_ANATE|nr:lectin-like [Anabas testudineus]XP_026234650.1 lectin-like [Anabas testudineus]